jgi:hypothetical protein
MGDIGGLLLDRIVTDPASPNIAFHLAHRRADLDVDPPASHRRLKRGDFDIAYIELKGSRQQELPEIGLDFRFGASLVATGKTGD